MIGEHENQVSEGGEGELQKYLAVCRKNPGHREFIPIQTFSLKHLPEGHHDQELYELIKATADLTVRISVTMTSPHRPEFWPNTKIPYFLSDMRGKRTFRSGTGKVSGLWNYTDTSCPCDQCKDADTASNLWWKIDVDTATHVVFDDIEASHTTLRFFYDSENSPVSILIYSKCSVVYANIVKDWCRISFVTCDKCLGSKLTNTLKDFNSNWYKVNTKYIDSRDVNRFNFIVSHPHGCFKQVTIGQWIDRYHVGGCDEKFTYTTCTCPGSSGAFVHCIGYNRLNIQVHSGTIMPKLNYSGVGSVW